MLLLFMTVLALIGVNAEYELSSYASDFNVAFLRQFSSTSRIEMIVLTKSTTPVQFNISSSTGYNYIGTTTANAATFVIIPSSLQVRESNYTYRHLGLHVTSSPSQPISVILVGYTSTPRSTYLALPCHDQPTDEYIYYGMSNDGGQNTNPYTFYSQILLVGCRDNTTVSITPTQTIQLPQDPQHINSATVTIIAGTSYTVTLHSLQTLLIAVQYKDLSGTKIVSNYPLTVVGGHDCTLVPQPYGDCDPIATQAPPTLNWGSQFLLTPLQNRTNGQRFKVIASENDTIVNATCPQSLLFNSVSAGHVIIFDVNDYTFCYIQCSHPCYIAELAFGRHYPLMFGSYGDPLLMTVPPIRQYPHSVTFTTLPEMPTNFYSIAVPADTYFNGTVIINGVLTALNWTSIFNSNGTISGYGYTTAANGNYTISHSHPNGKIYVSVYGFQIIGGCGYPAGMLLKSNNIVLVSFNASIYFVNEGDSHVIVYIERSENLDINATVSIETLYSDISTAADNQDYLSINQTVIFHSGETVKAVSIPILDDYYVEETEHFAVRIRALDKNIFYKLNETIVTIKDNDYMSIGFKQDVTTPSNTHEDIILNIVKFKGILQPGLISNINFQLQVIQGMPPSNISVFGFRHYISEYTVVLNVTQLKFVLSLTNDIVNITGRLVIDEGSSIHSILYPNEVNIYYNPNAIVPSSASMVISTSTSCDKTIISFITKTITSVHVTTHTPVSTVTVGPIVNSNTDTIASVVGGVMAVVLIIVIIACTIIVVGSYFYGERKGKRQDVNKDHIQMNPVNYNYHYIAKSEQPVPAEHISANVMPAQTFPVQEEYMEVSVPVSTNYTNLSTTTLERPHPYSNVDLPLPPLDFRQPLPPIQDVIGVSSPFIAEKENCEELTEVYEEMKPEEFSVM